MLETLLAVVSLAALIMLVRSAYRRVAQPVALPNPVLVQHEGEYNAVFAPHLNTAQPLIESFIHTLRTQLNVVRFDAGKNSSTLYFKIYDQETTAHRRKFYLLAITLRSGMLYFQAVSPHARDSNDEGRLLKTVQEASSRTLVNVPSHGTYYAEMDGEIITALTTAAQNQAIVAHPLTTHPNANTAIAA
ncbi:MAG: hypothetical protein ABL860_08880 [Candidatus Nitrotoga sp.]